MPWSRRRNGGMIDGKVFEWIADADPGWDPCARRSSTALLGALSVS
jgi:hypothetical protein